MASYMRVPGRVFGSRRVQLEHKVPMKGMEDDFTPVEKVIQRNRIEKQNPCLFEMSLVFACFKENNFSEKICSEEIKNFHNCYFTLQREPPVKYGTILDTVPAEEINKVLKKYKQ